MRRIHLLLLVVAILLIKTPLAAQIQISGSPDELMLLPELRVVLRLSGEEVVVGNKLPASPTAAKATTDIQEGDIVRFFAEKRIRSIVRLRELYEAAEDEEEIQVGLRRGAESIIVSFKKDSDAAQNSGMRMLRVGEEGFEGFDQIRPLPILGAIVGVKDGDVTVADVLPVGPRMKAVVEKFDVILAVDGAKVTSIDSLASVLEEIPVGDEVQLRVRRAGTAHEVTFKRPDMSGMRMMIRN